MRRASSAALSRTRENAADTFGCCCMPCTDGLAFSADSACARSAPASGTSCCGSSWSRSASTRWSGYSSGLPIRRASSCAAATASCDLSVRLLKSMSVLSGRHDVDGRPPHDEVAAVLPVHVVDRLAHLAFHPIEPPSHVHELVLQAQHMLDAGEIQPELVRQALDQPQPVEVGLGVQARVPRGALRPDQALVLVDAQRLRVHPDEVGRHGDHVARTVVHHSPPSLNRRSASTLRRIRVKANSSPTVPTETRMTAASFTRTAPRADSPATPSAAPR